MSYLPLYEGNKRHRMAPDMPMPHFVPSDTWEVIFFDVVGHTTPSNGYDCIWIFVDKLMSKMAHFVPIRKKGFTARDLAKIFFDNIFNLHGLPKSLVHDRDKLMTAVFFSSIHVSRGRRRLAGWCTVIVINDI